MAQVNNETKDAATAVSSNSGEFSEGVGLPFKCGECERVCKSKAGLTLHMRKVHAVKFHEMNVPETRVKNRWSEDEVYQLARKEADLVVSGILARKVNSELYAYFPHRSQEAIKDRGGKSNIRILCVDWHRSVRANHPVPRMNWSHCELELRSNTILRIWRSV